MSSRNCRPVGVEVAVASRNIGLTGGASPVGMSCRRAERAGDELDRATSEVGTSGLGGIRVQPRLEPEELEPPEATDGAFPTLEKMLPEWRDGAGEGVLNRGAGRVFTGECCWGCTGGSKNPSEFGSALNWSRPDCVVSRDIRSSCLVFFCRGGGRFS